MYLENAREYKTILYDLIFLDLSTIVSQAYSSKHYHIYAYIDTQVCFSYQEDYHITHKAFSQQYFGNIFSY